MRSRRKKKNKIIFLFLCNAGFGLSLAINDYEAGIRPDEGFSFQFYQTWIKRFFCSFSHENPHFEIF